MMRTRLNLFRTSIASILLAAAATAWPAIAATPVTTKVSYLAGASVYVDVGTLDGLNGGDTLRVVRGDASVALLKVSYASTRRAACDTVWTRGRIVIGDDVRFVPRSIAPSPTAPASGTAAATASGVAAPRRPSAHPQRLRGRVGARWLSVNSAGGRFQQPALDVSFDGVNSGGGHVDLSLDMRSRRTTRNFFGTSQQTDELARVYRATLTVRSLDSHQAITLGRQTSPTLASISLFDGLLVRTGSDHYALGLFSGTQPDPLRYDFSPDIVQSGAFMELHAPPRAVNHYTVALGGVTSQQRGQPNRDFLFAESNWFSSRFSSSLNQEVDINRGWKRQMGEPALAPTSTFGMARVMVTRWAGISGGYDNRRNVRLYRDRLTPETQFDDAYRQGTWVGGDLQVFQHLRFTVESRGTAGADHSSTWSWSSDAYRLGFRNLAMHARVSQYDGTGVASHLTSASLGFDPWPLSHIEASGGVRRSSVTAMQYVDIEHWQSVDVDLTLGRRWYANGGWESDYGGTSGRTRQVQAGLSWRF